MRPDKETSHKPEEVMEQIPESETYTEFEDVEQTPGIIGAIGELEPGTIITEAGLAKLFGRHLTSVKRAVDRGELPEPVKLFGQRSWTVRVLIEHHETRLGKAQKIADKENRRIAELSP